MATDDFLKREFVIKIALGVMTAMIDKDRSFDLGEGVVFAAGLAWDELHKDKPPAVADVQMKLVSA